MSWDSRTIEFYDAEAAAYATRQPLGAAKEALQGFAAALGPGAHILDLGCGGGQDSALLRTMGFKVTSVDASSALAASAARLWQIQVRVIDFVHLDYDGIFDAVLAHASLHHAPGEDLPAIFSRIRAALKAGGILHATVKGGAEARRDKFGRFYCAMDEGRLRALVCDWAEAKIVSTPGYGYDSEPTEWLTLDARR